MDPGNLRYRLLLARIYDRQCFVHYADREADRILAEVPGSADAWQSLGYLDLAWDDYQRALETITSEMRSVSDDPRWVLPISAGGFDLPLVDALGRPDEGTLPQMAAGEMPERGRFWRSKDPLLSSGLNQRILEQYRRFAYVAWHFAIPALGLRGWETQRGQIYLRYGEPVRSDDLTDEFHAKIRGELIPSLSLEIDRPVATWNEWMNRRTDGLRGSPDEPWVRTESELRLYSTPFVWEYPSVTFTFGDGMVSGNAVLRLPLRPGLKTVGTRKGFRAFVEVMPTNDYVVGGTRVFPMQGEWYAFRSPSGASELAAAIRLPHLPYPRERQVSLMTLSHPVYLLALDDDWRELARHSTGIPAPRLNYAAGSVWVSPLLTLPVLEFLGRLIRRREAEGAVIIVTEREGIQADSQESVRVVFPNDLDATRYRVRITVEDLVSGAQVVRSIELQRR